MYLKYHSDCTEHPSRKHGHARSASEWCDPQTVEINASGTWKDDAKHGRATRMGMIYRLQSFPPSGDNGWNELLSSSMSEDTCCCKSLIVDGVRYVVEWLKGVVGDGK